MKCIHDFDEAYQLLHQGDIIAYPTEAVYGLGCDPFNENAVKKLCILKGRDASKGFIILIHDWAQLERFTMSVPDVLLQPVHETWPGHVTWIFPKRLDIPAYLTGQRDTIAVRMTAHPIARQLCREMAIISTSANWSGQKPAKDIPTLKAQFPKGVAAYVAGALGDAAQPSVIYDVLSGKQLR